MAIFDFFSDILKTKGIISLLSKLLQDQSIIVSCGPEETINDLAILKALSVPMVKCRIYPNVGFRERPWGH